MSDHRSIVEHYLKAQFPNASIVDGHDTERHGHWWSIKEKDAAAMVLRVSQEFLTAQSDHEVRALLNNFNPAKALRGSAGRAVLLNRDGVTYVVTYVPNMPA